MRWGLRILVLPGSASISPIHLSFTARDEAAFWGAMGFCSPFCPPSPAGEVLRVTHLARGTDAAGALLLDSVISGSVPESIGEAAVLLQVPLLPVLPVEPRLPCWELGWGGVCGLTPLPASPQDFSERYVQTGAGQLSGSSVQCFLRDGHVIRVRCNHTIVYDPPTGPQSPWVRHVRASAIKASYNPASEELSFQLRASLDAGNKGIPRDGDGDAGIPCWSWVALRVQRPHPCSDVSLLIISA